MNKLLPLLLLLAIGVGLYFLSNTAPKASPALAVAEHVPAEAPAFLTFQGPKQFLELTIEAVESQEFLKPYMEQARAAAKQEVGFDPFNMDALQTATGLDLGRDSFAVLAGINPEEGASDLVFALGVSNLDKLRIFVEKVTGEDITVETQDGLSFAYPTTEPEACAVHDGTYLYIGFDSESWRTERDPRTVVTDFLAARKAGKLSGNANFQTVAPTLSGFPAACFVNFQPLIAAIPEEASEEMPSFLREFESFSMGFNLREVSGALTFTEGAQLLPLFQTGASTREFFKRLNKPVYALSVSLKDPFLFLELLRREMPEHESRQMNQQLNGFYQALDLSEEDFRNILSNVAVGAALYDIKPARYDFAADFVAFAKLNDSNRKIENAIGLQLRNMLKAQKEKVGEHEVYSWRVEIMEFAFVVLDGWFVIGDSDTVEDLVEGKVSTPWTPSIGNELASAYVNQIEAMKLFEKIALATGDEMAFVYQYYDPEDHFSHYDTTMKVQLDGRILKLDTTVDATTTGKFPSDLHYMAKVFSDILVAVNGGGDGAPLLDLFF